MQADSLRAAVYALGFALSLAGFGAHAQQARGVNPAEIDSRFDVILKRVELDSTGSTTSLTLKYDYRLNNQWGLNFELPVYTRLSQPGFSRTGTGDFFARARWIVPSGQWTYGASAETVLPVASKDELGTGRYQANVGALVVRAFSPSVLGAAVLKQVTSVGGDSSRASFSNTEFRIVPVLILDQGWALTGEIRQTWEHKSNLSWQRIEATLNKQFDKNWAGSVSLGTDTGDRKDRGAVSLATKYFF
ncbi:hypothetical protein [Piscinibacterium candidicorallinum]|uniref:DUF481 domain-containing protein n=1 Tax=Piscinibacterium candidicorallinum TaxID=1793872 RepID=A0ABV7H014_9BURK